VENLMQDGLIHIFMGVCSKIIIIKKFNVCLIKYNESKDPGSYKRSERSCYQELEHCGRKYRQHGYWIDGSSVVLINLKEIK
jgi:hypothetical protein